MIDLCVDARMAVSSGIGVCIRQIVPLLQQDPFRLILLVDQEGREWCRKFEQIVFPAPIYSVQEQIFFPMKVPQCDLFWSPHYNIPLLPIRAKKRIVTIHDVCHLALRDCFSSFERMYARYVMGSAFKRSDLVTTVSQFTAGELRRHFPRVSRKIEVIPNGIDRNRFQRVEDVAKVEAVRQKYQLVDPFVLFVGNLKRHKNVQGLVEAFLSIEEAKMKGWQLVLAGRMKGLRNGVGNLEENERIKVIGEVLDEELSSLYSLSSLFIFPSFYEGFGFPPLEAMACGSPTIVSRAASLKETCGDAPFYVDPTSPKEIAQAILRIVNENHLRESLIAKGFERVHHFNWEKTAERYRTLFEQITS